jgi:hypothetical protein
MRVHYFFVVFINFNFLLIFFFFNIKFTLSLSLVFQPAVCVDLTTKGLKDDAFSWHAPTRTLLVHSTAALANAALLNPSSSSSGAKDSQNGGGGGNPLSLGGVLDMLARRRGEAAYLPGGTLLLLPANLLNIASLASGFEAPLLQAKDNSKKAPAVGVPTANECLTVAFRFAGGEGDSSGLPAGALVGAWLFESVIGPVQSLTFDSADAALAAAAKSAQTQVTSPPSSPASDAAAGTTSAEILESYAAEASKMTVAELRTALAARGLPKTGLKAVLVERWAQAQVAAASSAAVAEGGATGAATLSSSSSSGSSRHAVETALANAATVRDPSLATIGAVAAAKPWLINTLSRYYIGTQRKKPAVLTRGLNELNRGTASGGTSSSGGGSGVVGSSASSVSLDLCLRLFSEEATRITKKRGVFAPRLADAAATR